MESKKDSIKKDSNDKISETNKKLMIIAVPVVVILLVVGFISIDSVTHLMGNSATGNKYTCEDSTFELKGNKCVKQVQEKAYLIGDVNKDGSVDIFDVRILRNYAVDKVTLDDYQQILGDVNKDGRVDTLDTVLVEKYIGSNAGGSLGSVNYINQMTCRDGLELKDNYCYGTITVDAIYRENNNNLDYKIGEKVTYKGIDFYVVKKYSNYIGLMKATPLTTSEILALGNYSASLIPETDGEITLGQYVFTENYSTSVIKQIVDAWANSNSLLANKGETVKLISENELINNLNLKVAGGGNNPVFTGFENSGISWDFVDYWIINGKNVYLGSFIKEGIVSNGIGAGPTGGAIRPVILINKNALQN